MVRLKVDVLVTSSTIAALAAKNATRTIPIIFYTVTDPVAAGLVDSLTRPGGNITGITDIGAVLSGKRLELLKETIPKLSRVAVLWDPQNPGNAQQWKESQLPARELGLQLHSMEVSSPDKYEGMFKEAIKARSAALAVVSSPLVSSNRKRIADLAEKNRLPAIYQRGDYVAGGGLMSYGPDRAEPYKRVASMADKILKGAKPADLPGEQPTRFEFVINLKTAKALNLTIPQSVLFRADRVIKSGSTMAEPDKNPVTMQELLVSSLVQADAIAKLLIEKGLITREEFMQKISEEHATCLESHTAMNIGVATLTNGLIRPLPFPTFRTEASRHLPS